MTRDPICLDSEMDISRAVEFFTVNHVSSAPVRGIGGKIVGQFPELGLMRAFVKRIFQDGAHKRVQDFSEQFVIPQFVSESASLPEVVSALIQTPLHRVLVRDASGELKGIISPKDILRVLHNDGKRSQSLTEHLHELETKVANLTKSLGSAEQGLHQYSSVFEASPYMMYSVGQSGRIVMANPMLHEILQYNPGELVGKSVYDLYPAHLHEIIKKDLENLLKDGSGHLNYSTYLSKTGKPIRIEVVSSAIANDEGKPIGIFTISHPVDGEAMLRALHGLLETKGESAR